MKQAASARERNKERSRKKNWVNLFIEMKIL